MNEEKSTTKSLTVGTRIAYGCGDTACNIVFGMISTLLTLFYTDYAGIPVMTVGLVMLISRVFDGTSDVIMGIIVNHTNTKWGKARPWIIWMAVPYCIAAVALFTVPQTNASLQFWYIFVTYNLCTTVLYTAINVPYGTLSTMMTRSSHERDLLSIFRMSMAPLGRIISVSLTMPVVKLFGDDQAAWVKTMSLWAAIALVMLVICFVRCKEEPGLYSSQNRPQEPLGESVKALLGNQYFWSTLILWTVTCVHGTIVGTSLPYYCKYIFQNDEWMYSVFYFAEAGTLVLGAMLCPLLLRQAESVPGGRRHCRCSPRGADAQPPQLCLGAWNQHCPRLGRGSADRRGLWHDGRRGGVRPVEVPYPPGGSDLRRRLPGL